MSCGWRPSSGCASGSGPVPWSATPAQRADQRSREGCPVTEVAYTRERRDRVRAPRAPRHRAPHPAENFSSSFTVLGDLAYEGAQVSASVTDLDSGRSLLGIDERIVLPTA